MVCEGLSEIIHGSISYSPVGSLRFENSMAEYTCNVGYNLTGESTRTCIVNATGYSEWSGTDPSCEGKLSFSCYLTKLIFLVIQRTSISSPGGLSALSSGTCITKYI